MDYDLDGYPDGTEISEGSDPKDKNSIPPPPNYPPTGISLSSFEVTKGAPPNTLIGYLRVSDPNPG